MESRDFREWSVQQPHPSSSSSSSSTGHRLSMTYLAAWSVVLVALLGGKPTWAFQFQSSSSSHVGITTSTATRIAVAKQRQQQNNQQRRRLLSHQLSAAVSDPGVKLAIKTPKEADIYERLANSFIKIDNLHNLKGQQQQQDDQQEDRDKVRRNYELISVFRTVIPAFLWALGAHLAYPTVAMTLANAIDDAGVFAVVSQDASQYIQNILTTSGLTFSIIAGQTYYFMYQQQEAIYLALFEEVTMAKSLLEQVSLVSQGRENLYQDMLASMNQYVKDDLTRFNDFEPAELIAARPVDDPLENILYLTSVGEPSIVYQTVRSLRQARAFRLGALQRKLPPIHTGLLWTLAFIVLFTFPLLGAGSQTIGGPGILTVQAWYLSFIVFGITLVMGVIDELQRPGDKGAYNARTVLAVMVCGLVEDLELRLSGDMGPREGPSIDADGFDGYRSEERRLMDIE